MKGEYVLNDSLIDCWCYVVECVLEENLHVGNNKQWSTISVALRHTSYPLAGVKWQESKLKH
jgi:hypothetical protein